MSHPHFIHTCRCGAVITQCRCASPSKVKTIVQETCPRCVEQAADEAAYALQVRRLAKVGRFMGWIDAKGFYDSDFIDRYNRAELTDRGLITLIESKRMSIQSCSDDVWQAEIDQEDSERGECGIAWAGTLAEAVVACVIKAYGL